MSDLDDEIQSHIQHEIECNLARGMSREQAETAASRKFGNRLRVKEEVRRLSPWTSLDGLRQNNMALGSSPGQVGWLIGRETVVLAALGVLLGVPMGAMGTSAVLRGESVCDNVAQGSRRGHGRQKAIMLSDKEQE